MWRINVDGSDLREVTNEPGLNQMYPSLSPDGARMASSDQDARTLAIYDTRDFSKPLQLVTAPGERKTGALQVHDWSPDGRSFLLVATSPGGRPPDMWRYVPETETGRRIGLCATPTWMRDGRRIVCGRPGRLVVVDAVSLSETEQPWTLSRDRGQGWACGLPWRTRSCSFSGAQSPQISGWPASTSLRGRSSVHVAAPNQSV